MKGFLQGLAQFFVGVVMLLLLGGGTIGGGAVGIDLAKPFDSWLITIVGVIMGAVIGLFLSMSASTLLVVITDAAELTDSWQKWWREATIFLFVFAVVPTVCTVGTGWAGVVMGNQYDSWLITLAGLPVGLVISFGMALILFTIAEKNGLIDTSTSNSSSESSSSSYSSYSPSSSNSSYSSGSSSSSANTEPTGCNSPYMWQHDMGPSELSWTATHTIERAKCRKCGRVFSERTPR